VPNKGKPFRIAAACWVTGQYPGEKEITFPPYTCLEADGDPRVEYTDKGEVVVFPLKVSPPSLQGLLKGLCVRIHH
jgi:hypothetical protein